MLAQNFKTADELGIQEDWRAALAKTLVLLETGKLRLADTIHQKFDNEAKRKFDGLFNMSCWGSVAHRCGTIACIGGTAELVGNVSFGHHLSHITELPIELHELFYVKRHNIDWHRITPSQAATALRSYLTTGDARWDLAVQT